jgi:hypothetical protein
MYKARSPPTSGIAMPQPERDSPDGGNPGDAPSAAREGASSLGRHYVPGRGVKGRYMSKLEPPRFIRALVPEPGIQRVYGLAALINTIGFGLILPAVALYFTRIVHLSGVQVGLGFTISGVIAIPAAIPAGELADRFGPRRAVLWAIFLQGVTGIAYLFIRDFLMFVIVDSLAMIVTTAYFSSVGALIRRVGGDNTAAFRSKVRAISNLGISLGVLGAGVGIEIGTAFSYRALLLINALTFFAAWALLMRVPNYKPLPRPEEKKGEKGPRWIALRDAPFVAYTAVAGVMSIQGAIIQLPLPLWIVSHTNAPRWTVTVMFLVNTGLVILYQVKMGEKVKTLRDGGTAMRRAGFVFLGSCAVIGLTSGLPAWAAFVLLLCAIMLLTLGEIWYSAGTYAFEFGMPPAYAQGQYQGVAGTGSGLGSAAAPVLLVGLVLSLGRAGWIGLGVAFALLGLFATGIAVWGERTRVAVPDSM